MKLKVLDLFSGIGGFSLGLERTGGFETVAFCEIDSFCRQVLAKHWPGVPIHDDIQVLSADWLAETGAWPDVICGGFPCQDISVAGKGAGLGGERSGLWRDYARLIGEIRPRYVLVENVAALLGRGFGDVLGDLAALGYDAEWHCIPASYVGAPHRRDRVWIVAYPASMFRDGSNDYTRCNSQGAVKVSEPGDGCNNEDMAHADYRDRHGRGCDVQMGRIRIARQTEGDGVAGGVQWGAEPDVGGSPHGFPAWLDKYVGWGLSYDESLRRAKVLRDLWRDHVSQALLRAAGGLERLSQAEVLFTFVREYENGSDQARLLLAGKEASECFLRSLRDRAVTRSPSHRSRQNEQRPIEHPDPLQPMSRLLACDSKEGWATGGWEDATPRVAYGVADRVDRLKALGNAVVPQIPELIGRAILEAHR